MKIYKILAIIVIILSSISFITYRLCKNDLKAYIGMTGTINGISNLLLCLLFPIDLILFILNV